MILIIGGACQGKLKYGFDLLGFEDINRELYAAGESDSLESAFEMPVVYQFNQYIRRLLEMEQDVRAWVLELIQKNPNAVVISDEIGSGIVPMKPEDREYRDAVGKAAQELASASNQVIRVLCGIGMRIK